MSHDHPIITRMRELDRALSERDRLEESLKKADMALLQAKADLHQALETCNGAMAELIRGQRIELTDCIILVDEDPEQGFEVQRREPTLQIYTLQARLEEGERGRVEAGVPTVETTCDSADPLDSKRDYL